MDQLSTEFAVTTALNNGKRSVFVFQNSGPVRYFVSIQASQVYKIASLKQKSFSYEYIDSCKERQRNTLRRLNHASLEGLSTAFIACKNPPPCGLEYPIQNLPNLLAPINANSEHSFQV